VQVFGISTDDVNAQKKFAEEQELKYSLLSDPDGSAAGKYGVLRERRGSKMASRVTFIIDDKGVLRGIDQGVSVASHGADLTKLITELRGN
jgi:peroxiredoxin Q/BCP